MTYAISWCFVYVAADAVFTGKIIFVSLFTNGKETTNEAITGTYSWPKIHLSSKVVKVFLWLGGLDFFLLVVGKFSLQIKSCEWTWITLSLRCLETKRITEKKYLNTNLLKLCWFCILMPLAAYCGCHQKSWWFLMIHLLQSILHSRERTNEKKTEHLTGVFCRVSQLFSELIKYSVINCMLYFQTNGFFGCLLRSNCHPRNFKFLF